ncbi:MAG: molybdopterin molybdenumtransferase MoeA [Halobacteriovoraceae bacterium]|nr:molybdopterin molybdenumtransferase MoeA [Halobacteriovoraceae bacterium]
MGGGKFKKGRQMISVQEAQDFLVKEKLQKSAKKVTLEDSAGQLLAEDIFAERPQPPFNRVAMDGISINSSAWASLKDKKPLIIEGVQAAGSKALTLSETNRCFEVMTGAPLPTGCDTVIPYEHCHFIDAENSSLKIREVILKDQYSFSKGQNIHNLGSDYQKGELLLSKGTLITPPVLGVLASEGYGDVLIQKKPKIALISTGDELVPVKEKPLEYQIRTSNTCALKADLELRGYTEVDVFHLRDDPQTLFEKFKSSLESYDLVIITGGVSKGKFDYVPSVLSDLGVQKIFHKIMQRPGKPMWFGKCPKGTLVFGLPGNPVSCIVCLRRYVIPMIEDSWDRDLDKKVVLKEDFAFSKNLTFYLPVSIERSPLSGKLMAKPQKTNGSGDYFSLTKSDGFIELPRERTRFYSGEAFVFYSWAKGGY